MMRGTAITPPTSTIRTSLVALAIWRVQVSGYTTVRTVGKAAAS